MLDEHKLGMSDVQFDEREVEEPIEWLHVGRDDFEFGSRKEWQGRLAREIAECNGCKMIWEGGWRPSRRERLRGAQQIYVGNQFWFVGRTSDRELCKILFLYFVELAFHLEELAHAQEQGTQKFLYVESLEEWEDFCLPTWRKWMKDWKDSWFYGFSVAVVNRLYDRHAASMKSASGSNAIVRIEKDLDAVKESLKGKTKKSGSGRQGGFNEDGYKRGKRSGNAVNLSPHTFTGATGRVSRLLGE